MKRKLISAFLVLMLFSLAVQDIPLVIYLRSTELERVTTTLERDAFIIAGRSEEYLDETPSTQYAYLNNILSSYSKGNGSRVIVTDSDGLVVATSDSLSTIGDSSVDRPEVVEALNGTVAAGVRFSSFLNYEILYVAVPILSRSETVGVVRITIPYAVVKREIDNRIKVIGAVGGLTLALASLVGLLLALSISRHLSKLRDVTDEFSHGDLNVRADESGGESEIRTLAKSFNVMASLIEKLVAEQRAFASDASHQLRTPLTALQLRLERCLEMMETDPEGATQRLEAAMDEAHRLQLLVEGLLILSRSDNTENLKLETVDAVSISMERLNHWEPLASENKVQLLLDGPEHAGILALPGVLEQVIDNFIDNALEAVEPGTSITLKIIPSDELTKISVIDQGPGIPAENLPKVFNRFWRGRSDSQGTGLGLAIVDRLTRASGGHAELVNLDPVGLSADAYFPTA